MEGCDLQKKSPLPVTADNGFASCHGSGDGNLEGQESHNKTLCSYRVLSAYIHLRGFGLDSPGIKQAAPLQHGC
jgi:hypothetical protein